MKVFDLSERTTTKLDHFNHMVEMVVNIHTLFTCNTYCFVYYILEFPIPRISHRIAERQERHTTYEVLANTERLYLCVLAAPDKYNRNAWDDDETNDEQWPYRVKFSGTDLLGNVTIPEGAPTDLETSLEVSLDASSESYPLHTFNLLNNGVMEKIAKAFKLQPSEIASATLEAGDVKAEGFTGPADGKVAVGLTNPDASEKGKTYIIKPTMVYNKNGKQHKAVITIKMCCLNTL